MSAPTITLPAMASYQLVATQSTAAFAATAFFGMATVRGTIGVKTGRVTIVDGRAKVAVELTAGTVNTQNRRRDKDLRSKRFLDADTRASLVFDGELDKTALQGTLRLGDRSTPVTLAVTEVTDTTTGRITVTATGELDRTTLGVGPRGSFIGKVVRLEITAILQ